MDHKKNEKQKGIMPGLGILDVSQETTLRDGNVVVDLYKGGDDLPPSLWAIVEKDDGGFRVVAFYTGDLNRLATALEKVARLLHKIARENKSGCKN